MANSLMLYVGKLEAGQALAALAEQHNDYVYLPDSMMEALGMYITYFPRVTIIDMSVDYAPEVFDHLRSVDADPIVLLSDYDLPIIASSIYTLPRNLAPEALLEALERVRQPQTRRSNGVLHYA